MKTRNRVVKMEYEFEVQCPSCGKVAGAFYTMEADLGADPVTPPAVCAECFLEYDFVGIWQRFDAKGTLIVGTRRTGLPC